MTLARWQRNVIYAGLAVCLIALLFPPVTVMVTHTDYDAPWSQYRPRPTTKSIEREWGFFAAMPSESHLDVGMLLLEVAIIGVATALSAAGGDSIVRRLGPLFRAARKLRPATSRSDQQPSDCSATEQGQEQSDYATEPAQPSASPSAQPATGQTDRWQSAAAEGPGMRLLVLGSAEYQFMEADRVALDDLHRQRRISEILVASNSGAARCGAAWASERGITTRTLRGDVAHEADALALFPCGRDPARLLASAASAGLTVFDFRRLSPASATTTGTEDSGKIVRVTCTQPALFEVKGFWPEVWYHLRWWLALFAGVAALSMMYNLPHALTLYEEDVVGGFEFALGSGIGAVIVWIILAFIVVPLVVGMLHLIAAQNGRTRCLVITPGRLSTRRWMLGILIPAVFMLGIMIRSVVRSVAEANGF